MLWLSVLALCGQGDSRKPARFAGHGSLRRGGSLCDCAEIRRAIHCHLSNAAGGLARYGPGLHENILSGIVNRFRYLLSAARTVLELNELNRKS
jgi:hypothetical protein